MAAPSRLLRAAPAALGLALLVRPLAIDAHGAVIQPRPRNQPNFDGFIPMGITLQRTGEGKVAMAVFNVRTCERSGVQTQVYPVDLCVRSPVNEARPSYRFSFDARSIPAGARVFDCTTHSDCTAARIGHGLQAAVGGSGGFESGAASNASAHHGEWTPSDPHVAGGEQLVWLSVFRGGDGCGRMPELVYQIRRGVCTQLPVGDSDYWAGGCAGLACQWFSQGCEIGCSQCSGVGHGCNSTSTPTLSERQLRTFNRDGSDAAGDWTASHPWRSPGAAPVFDACGIASGSPLGDASKGGHPPPGHRVGDRGSALPPLPGAPTVWSSGAVVNVSWGIAANHGGGYQYRLCPRSELLTEECFQRLPLPFEGGVQWLQLGNGSLLTVPATRVSAGTTPRGSTWTMNPVPACRGPSGLGTDGCARPQFPPPRGCDQSCWGTTDNYTTATVMPTVIDALRLPNELAPGDYVLGWRWDCEETTQVWASCADVCIVASTDGVGAITAPMLTY